MAGALVCGAITAGALAGVLSALDEYQVSDYADMDPTIGAAGALVAAIAAAAVIGVIRVRPRPHMVVPLLLVPAVILPLVAGLERNRVEAGLLWGAVAFAIHLSIGRRRATTAIAVTLILAAGLTWALQDRWRGQKFEAVGIPLYVPDVPGHDLVGAWAGRYSVTLRLTGDVDVWLTSGDFVRCRRGATDRFVTLEGRPAVCLPGGDDAAMVVDVPPQTPFTVRPVDGAELARYPDDGTPREPD
ncbi:hypothetical protein KOI35_24290 [Actinoplanes bogorensis]|uniref:Uncharacterized protein n=1 Tax=Paractinoplanes bogorensis TaxID=1610840 RepID=A0ABS5YVA2_9ACTN|nr:hypothetical protein [Actinoplanes bogorensis]MBU2666633.1 hypothetical protein [Actinoplanes bogorensis]